MPLGSQRLTTKETNSQLYKMCFIPGNSLSPAGYHLCIHNKTRNVTYLAVHKDPYTVTQLCGGWLPLKTCTVTRYRMTQRTEYKTVVEQATRCCDDYVQVGRYCALRECTAHHLSIQEIIEEQKMFLARFHVFLYKCV